MKGVSLNTNSHNQNSDYVTNGYEKEIMGYFNNPSRSNSPLSNKANGIECADTVGAMKSFGGPPSPGFGGDVGLTRLLSVKRPNGSVLSDAMALALFRVGED